MNRKIKKYISFHAFLFLLIMCIAIFFRFYNTPNRYGFDYDPTRDALIIMEGAKTRQFPIIGAPSGIGQFAFGPWYYYQLIIFEILFPFDYSPWIYIGILSVFSVFVMYKIGIVLEGKIFGLLLASLAALSPAETGQIRALSNPTLVPIHAMLTVWLFIKFVKTNPSHWLAFLWGLILGIGINNHYQMLGVLPLPIIIFIYKKEKRFLRIIAFLLGMFVAFMPLLLFNLFHDWNTAKGIVFYITQGKNSIYIPNRWLYYIKDFCLMFWSYILGVPTRFGVALILYTGIGFLYLLLKRKMQIIYAFLILVFGINFLILRNFPQREYYYLLYLHPFIFIFFGLIVWHTFRFKFGKHVGLIILIIVFTGMILQSKVSLGTREDYVLFKKEAEGITNNYPNKKFVLYECKDSQKNRVRGIVFFLSIKNKISEDGVKIAFPNEKCVLPKNRNNLPLVHLQGIDAIDISYFSEGALFKYGWKPVTAKTVFMEFRNGA